MLVYIYKLYNENDCYIGSTKHPLHKRLSQHKSKHNRCCSKLIIEQGDYKMEQIDETYIHDWLNILTIFICFFAKVI